MSGTELGEPRHVRMGGAFCLAGGGFLMAFYQGMWLRGVVPVPWVGGGIVALGVWGLVDSNNPWLRRRVGRVLQLMRGEPLD